MDRLWGKNLCWKEICWLLPIQFPFFFPELPDGIFKNIHLSCCWKPRMSRQPTSTDCLSVNGFDGRLDVKYSHSSRYFDYRKDQTIYCRAGWRLLLGSAHSIPRNTHTVLWKNLSTQWLEIQYSLRSQHSRKSENGVSACICRCEHRGTMTLVTHMLGTEQDKKIFLLEILRMPKIYSLTLTTDTQEVF